MEEAKFTGIWQDVEREDGAYGILEFAPDDGAKLSTVNSLDSSQDDSEFWPAPFQMMANASSGSATRHSIVQGKDVSGNPITLLDVVRNNTSFGWSNNGGVGGESTYRVSKVLKGRWFDEEPKFDYLKTKLPHFEEWCELTGISQQIEKSDDGNSARLEPGDKVKLVMEVPESVEAEFGNYNISLESSVNTDSNNLADKSIQAEMYVKIESDEPESLESLKEEMRKVQNLVSLGMMKGLQPVEVKAGWNGERKEVEVLHQIDTGLIPEDLPYRKYMNFTFRDISDDFEEILEIWEEKYEELKPVFDLYFSALYNPQMYIENKLMTMAHAVESYFRETEDATYLDEKWDDVNQDFIDFMHGDVENLVSEGSNLETLKEKHELHSKSDFLSHMANGTLEYANEYSLRKMIKELTDKHEDLLEGIEHNPIGKSGLIADTRNYLVHRTEELKESGTTEHKEQIKLTWSLRLLLEVCILRDLGIEDEHIKERLGTRYANKRVS
jgi:hypothetical protein